MKLDPIFLLCCCATSILITTDALHLQMTTTNTIRNTHSHDTITVLGFGSLLSERSSRLTFPNLTHFRLGRVPHHRRVFAHPAPLFFKRGIANVATQEICSLSAEYEVNSSFICSVFEVPSEGLVEMGHPSKDQHQTRMIPSQAFLEREEEFDIQQVPYLEGTVDVPNHHSSSSTHNNILLTSSPKVGILCCRSTDDQYRQQWGNDRFLQQFQSWGLETIWNYPTDSGIRPCATYLRHCVLAAQRMGPSCYQSFLDDTFLIDRTTTIRTYLKDYPEIMMTLPPPELAERYGG